VKADRVQKGVRGGCRGEAAQQGEARVATAALSERRRLIRSRQIRRIFFVELFRVIRVVWPALSGVILAMIGPGLLIGHIEGWRIIDALYFTFVTGLTIGYGDLTPRHVVSRLLAVVIGLAGIVLTGLVAAVSVEALRAAARDAGE
jgi:hypothetical protein